jgi:hypothetical protein
MIFRWHLNNAYAARKIRIGKNQRTVQYMHRFLMNPRPGFEVDHANGDCLDNRRHNLRVVPHYKNSGNFTKTAGRHGFVGVSFYKNRQSVNCWRAKYDRQGKTIHVGFFPTVEAAARAYDNAIRAARPGFARLNFPKVGEKGIFKTETGAVPGERRSPRGVSARSGTGLKRASSTKGKRF